MRICGKSWYWVMKLKSAGDHESEYLWHERIIICFASRHLSGVMMLQETGSRHQEVATGHHWASLGIIGWL